jgi:hypothetical protein
MSEDKPRLPKLEMPKLSREFLDGYAVTLETAGRALREFGDTLRVAYPSIRERAGSLSQAVQPLMRKTEDQ